MLARLAICANKAIELFLSGTSGTPCGRDTPQLIPRLCISLPLMPPPSPLRRFSGVQPRSIRLSCPSPSSAPALPKAWTPKTDGIRSVWADRTLLRCYRSDIHHYGRGNPAGGGISPLDFHCR